jgi:hypothetical protein
MSIAGCIVIATAAVGGETEFVVAAGIAIGAVEHLYETVTSPSDGFRSEPSQHTL